MRSTAILPVSRRLLFAGARKRAYPLRLPMSVTLGFTSNSILFSVT